MSHRKRPARWSCPTVWEDEMDGLAYKVRLAVFWLLSTVAFTAYRTLALSEEASEVSLLGNNDFAIYLVVMMAFTCLTLTVPMRLNRLVNLIAGGIVGVAQMIMLVDGLLGYPTAPFNLMTGVTVVSMGSIVWLAYRWHQPATEQAEADMDRDQRRRTPVGV